MSPDTERVYDTSVLSAAANNYSDTTLTSEMRNDINEFLTVLATCNTVVVSSHSHNATSANGAVSYPLRLLYCKIAV